MAYCSDCGAHETDTGGNLVHRATCTRYTVTPIIIKDAPTPKQISRDDVMTRAAEFEGGNFDNAVATAAMLRSLMDELENRKALYKDLGKRFADKCGDIGNLRRQLAAANERIAELETGAKVACPQCQATNVLATAGGDMFCSECHRYFTPSTLFPLAETDQ